MEFVRGNSNSVITALCGPGARCRHSNLIPQLRGFGTDLRGAAPRAPSLLDPS